MEHRILNRVAVLMFAVFVCCCFVSAALAQETEEVNNGQDLTKPLTRLDLRVMYQDIKGDYENYVLTARVDKPFVLGGGWVLSTRLDLPMMWSNVPSGDNLDGDMHFGLSDTLIQALVIAPPLSSKWAVAFGTQVIFPTATEDSLGTGKFQLAPLFAVKYDLGKEITSGSFALLMVKHTIDVGGDEDRAHINTTTIQPVLNVNLPKYWFVTFAPEYRYDWNSDKSFLSLNTLVGKMITKSIVMSVEYRPAVVNDAPLWEHVVEFRIGYFF